MHAPGISNTVRACVSPARLGSPEVAPFLSVPAVLGMTLPYGNLRALCASMKFERARFDADMMPHLLTASGFYLTLSMSRDGCPALNFGHDA